MTRDERPEYLTPLQRFGHEVREVRRGRNITQKGLGMATGYSEGYVSKVEKGTMMPSERFAQKCDLVFQTHGLFTRLREGIAESESPPWFVPYLQLEWTSAGIFDFSATSIMGIFQTEDYARAIFRAGHPRESPEVVHGKVVARMARRKLLEKPDPPMLWVVLHEACLRTLVGGRSVMAAQLEHLLRSAESPAVDFQVIPFSAGAVAAHTNPFTLLTFESAPTVLYAGDPQGGKMYRSSELVTRFSQNCDRLRAHALAPDDSLTLIDQVRKEHLL
ncbi:helix-turn-helix domain-containing protein [Kitasatospora sp. NPDC056076]|uniref:helix-turn-helix domain-containing protein n=1 Tax=Kitasatospora sp. NPDC056076 TaxID=3345703 RepID=UPI0035D8DADB